MEVQPEEVQTYEPDGLFVSINENIPRYFFFSEANDKFDYKDSYYTKGVERLCIIYVLLTILAILLIFIGQSRRKLLIPEGTVSIWLRACLLACTIGMTVTAFCEVFLHKLIRIEEKVGFHVDMNDEIKQFWTENVRVEIENNNVLLMTPFNSDLEEEFGPIVSGAYYDIYKYPKAAFFANGMVTKEVKKFIIRSNEILDSLYLKDKHYPLSSVYTDILKKLEWFHFISIMILLCSGLVAALLLLIIKPYVIGTIFVVVCCNIIGAVQTLFLVEYADICVSPLKGFETLRSEQLDIRNDYQLQNEYKKACHQWYEDFDKGINKIMKPFLISRMYAWKTEEVAINPIPESYTNIYFRFMYIHAGEYFTVLEKLKAPPMHDRCLKPTEGQNYVFAMDSICDANNIMYLLIQVIAMMLSIVTTVIILLLVPCFMRSKNVCLSPVCSEFLNVKTKLVDEKPRFTLIKKCLHTINSLLKCRPWFNYSLKSKRRKFLEALAKYPPGSDEYEDHLEEYRRYLVKDPGIIDKYPDVFKKHPRLLELLFERDSKLLDQHLVLMSWHPEVLKRLIVKHPNVIHRNQRLLQYYPELEEYHKSIFDKPEEPPDMNAMPQPEYSLERFTCSRYVCEKVPCKTRFVCHDPWTCPGVSPREIPRNPNFPLPPGQSDPTSSSAQKKKEQSLTRELIPSPKIMTDHIPCGRKICIKNKRCICEKMDLTTVLLKGLDSATSVIKFDYKERMQAPYVMIKHGDIQHQIRKRKKEEFRRKLKERLEDQRDCIEDTVEGVQQKMNRVCFSKLPKCTKKKKKENKKIRRKKYKKD